LTMIKAGRSSRFVLFLLLVGSLLCTSLFSALALNVNTVAAAPTMTGLHVVSNQVLNGDGQVRRLPGVNRSGRGIPRAPGTGRFRHHAASCS